MKTVKKFDMDAWYLGQDIDDLYSVSLLEFAGNIKIQCEAMTTLLEKRFETCVKKGISMALEFITNDDDYCFAMFSTFVDEFNPKGEPVIKVFFGDEDYATTCPLSDLIEMCEDDYLDIIEKAIIDERSKRK